MKEIFRQNKNFNKEPNFPNTSNISAWSYRINLKFHLTLGS